MSEQNNSSTGVAEAAAAVDAAAAEAAQQQQGTAEGAEQQGEQQQAAAAEPPAKTSRDAIYARHREQRQTDIDEDPERHAAVSALAGRPTEEAGEQQAGAENSSAEALALNTGKVKIKVDGQEDEVPVEQVLEAGRRALQKDFSADKKLRNAASMEQLAAERLAEVQRREQALTNSGDLPSSGARRDGADSHLSEQDAGEGAEAVVNAAVSQARDALFDGDNDKASQVMVKSSRDAVVAETNQMFVAEFSDIATDPVAMRKAMELMNAELAKNPSFAKIPVIAARIGNQVRTEYFSARAAEPAAQQQATGASTAEQQGGDAPSTDRSARKVRLPAMPSRATAKTPDSAKPAAPQRLTPGQIVQNMRVARGQARP